MTTPIERAIFLCDSSPQDWEAWDELYRILQRGGANGPLFSFVKKTLYRLQFKKGEINSDLFMKSFEPFRKKGFIVEKAADPISSVLHLGRIRENDGNRYNRFLGTRRPFLLDPFGEPWPFSYEGKFEWLCQKGWRVLRKEHLETLPYFDLSRISKQPPCASCLKQLGTKKSFAGNTWFWNPEETPISPEDLEVLKNFREILKARY